MKIKYTTISYQYLLIVPDGSLACPSGPSKDRVWKAFHVCLPLEIFPIQITWSLNHVTSFPTSLVSFNDKVTFVSFCLSAVQTSSNIIITHDHSMQRWFCCGHAKVVPAVDLRVEVFCELLINLIMDTLWDGQYLPRTLFWPKMELPSSKACSILCRLIRNIFGLKSGHPHYWLAQSQLTKQLLGA